MKKTILAALALTPAFFAQAETVTFNATQCETKHNIATKDLFRGTVESRSQNHDTLYCDIPVQSGKIIDNVSVSVFSLDVKENYARDCRVTLRKADDISYVVASDTNNATDYKSVLTSEPLATISDDIRATLMCAIPAVEQGGLVRFNSYSITYLD